MDQSANRQHQAVDLLEKILGENWPHALVTGHEKIADKDGGTTYQVKLRIPPESERQAAAAAAQAGAGVPEANKAPAAASKPQVPQAAPVTPQVQQASGQVQIKVAMGGKEEVLSQYPAAFLKAMGLA